MRRKRFALFGIALLLLVGLLSGAYFIVEYKNAMREQDETRLWKAPMQALLLRMTVAQARCPYRKRQ